MPVNMGLAALLMSGAMQSGKPTAKFTLDALTDFCQSIEDEVAIAPLQIVL